MLGLIATSSAIMAYGSTALIHHYGTVGFAATVVPLAKKFVVPIVLSGAKAAGIPSPMEIVISYINKVKTQTNPTEASDTSTGETVIDIDFDIDDGNSKPK